MLHQISWSTYTVTLISLVVLYYGYVGLAYFRPEIRSALKRLTGGQPADVPTTHGDLQLADASVMGKAQYDEVGFVSQDELLFGPADTDEPDEQPAGRINSSEAPNARLISSFSEMISEVKTLNRVINESSESKENFEMLFRLIVQKYPELTGTPFQEQVNDFLLSEGAPQFPFELSLAEIESYWIN
jgi:hypothetical protein